MTVSGYIPVIKPMEGSCDLELGLGLRPRHDECHRVAQFTVMYNGEVCVCEDVSEDQAKAIVLLTSRGADEGKRRHTRRIDELSLSLNPPPTAQPQSESCGMVTPVVMSLKGCNNSMSMKRSLQRFLEKRKLRMQRPHASPY